MSLFNSCADLGDKIIGFLKERKLHAIIIVILFFISPVNIIMWILMLCSIYRKGKGGKK